MIIPTQMSMMDPITKLTYFATFASDSIRQLNDAFLVGGIFIIVLSSFSTSVLTSFASVRYPATRTCAARSNSLFQR
jgi:hypothetical protein